MPKCAFLRTVECFNDIITAQTTSQATFRAIACLVYKKRARFLPPTLPTEHGWGVGRKKFEISPFPSAKRTWVQNIHFGFAPLPPLATKWKSTEITAPIGPFWSWQQLRTSMLSCSVYVFSQVFFYVADGGQNCLSDFSHLLFWKSYSDKISLSSALIYAHSHTVTFKFLLSVAILAYAIVFAVNSSFDSLELG